MERTERDMSNNVLQSIGEVVPSLVLRNKDTKEEAEKYIKDIKEAIELIEKTFKK
jgi:hypothetical protein